MTARFGARSTADEVLAGLDLSGRRALVTGVSAGLGVETARALAAAGAHVVGTGRDLDKARRAADAAGMAAEGERLKLIGLDLASLADVRRCADILLADSEPFDMVIANAGVMACPKGVTVDGFETQFGTNHLGHFVLVNRIAPLLRDGSRVVVLASAGHRYGDVDLDDPGFERTAYDPVVAYGRSKTANILFAVEFDRRHRGRDVRAAAVHPGGIQTELTRHIDRGRLDSMMAQINRDLADQGAPPFELKSVPQGAATTVWAAARASADEIGGHCCEHCHVSRVVPDDWKITPVSEGVRAYAVDPARAQALWAKSEAMVGESFS